MPNILINHNRWASLRSAPTYKISTFAINPTYRVRFEDPKSGYQIVKDRAGGNSHGGNAWKLLDRTGARVATLDAKGMILRP
jgi:filamentous hemagglutinin